jgi:signal transduction histidine kinase
LLCDAARLVQLLSNLLKNAIIHGSRLTPVEVKIRQSDDIFELSVTNSGPAIPAEIQAQLFKPFWQSQQNDTGHGLGLGLFIASEIAVSHGGVLEVVSLENTTTFTYRSPNKKDKP